VFVVVPMIDNGSITIHDNFLITCMFTVIAVIRGYLWRRFFNKELHKVIHNILRKANI
jgi:hypothetical protein